MLYVPDWSVALLQVDSLQPSLEAMESQLKEGTDALTTVEIAYKVCTAGILGESLGIRQ